MIGFDRPLRPRWIYEALQLWKPETRLKEFHSGFNHIAHELSGREGKRKVRTVLFRYFFDFEGHASNQITKQKSLLALASQQGSLEELKPAYLIVLLDRSETTRKILDNILRLFPFGRPISTVQLIEKTVELHGERDVVKRSTCSFLMTLVHFGILRRNGNDYEWVNRLACSPKSMAYALIFYCSDERRMEIDLREIRQEMRFRLLDLGCLEDCAKKYNGTLWSFIRRPGTAKIMLSQDSMQKIASM